LCVAGWFTFCKKVIDQVGSLPLYYQVGSISAR